MQTQVPLNQLRASPSNVRRAKSDVLTLASSIQSCGLLQPPVVTIGADPATYEVIAGSRRLAALQLLVENGVYAPDREIAVLLIADGANATEASLAENIIRQGMTAADEVRAFKSLVDEGVDGVEIARRFGFKVEHVARRLALANLAPKVFECFERGDMNLECAQAFTLNPDHKAQMAVFRDCYTKANGFQGHAHWIRQRLLDDVVRGNDRRVRLVGGEAILEAGGKVTHDLFADEDGAYYSPSTLIQELADAKMIVEANRLAKKHKLGFVRSFTQSYLPYDVTGLIRQDEKPKKDALGKALLGKVLLLNGDGEMSLSDDYYTDRPLPRIGTTDDSDTAPPASAASNLSQKAVRDLADQRRDVLRAVLSRRPQLAHAIMLFASVDRLNFSMGYYGNPSGSLITTADHPRGVEESGQLQAAVEYQGFIDSLERSWCRAGNKQKHRDYDVAGNVAARLDAFLALPTDEHQRWATFALLESLTSGDNDVHSYVAQVLSIDARAEWTPTVGNYFGYLSKGQMIAMLAEVDEPASKAVAKAKAAEAKVMLEMMASPTGLEEFPAATAFMQTFVPDQLTFRQPEADEAPELDEESNVVTIVDEIAAEAEAEGEAQAA